jgi:nitrite reductase/ring-hydroxylating ferredoxin subunit
MNDLDSDDLDSDDLGSDDLDSDDLGPDDLDSDLNPDCRSDSSDSNRSNGAASIPSLLCRRNFLKRFHAFMAFCLFAACRSTQNAGDRLPPMNLGPLSQFGEGRTMVDLYRLVVLKEGRTLAAVSAVCTHQTCLLTMSDQNGFDCPCHGSRFAADGSRISGPAPRGLPWYELEVDAAGNVLVYRDREVPPAWRYQLKSV